MFYKLRRNKARMKQWNSTTVCVCQTEAINLPKLHLKKTLKEEYYTLFNPPEELINMH